MPEPTADPRPLPRLWADFIRGSVRLMVPIACLALLAGLLYSAQGRDVLRALISASTHVRTGHAIDGLLFLMAGSTALSLSVWYSSRWLLTAQMEALPLQRTGFWQTWLPRLMGFAAPLMVAIGLLGLNHGPLRMEESDARATRNWALGFAALAAALLAFYVVRGRLLGRWSTAEAGGPARRIERGVSRPGTLGITESMPETTLLVVIWSIALSLSLGALFFLFPITLPRAVGAAAVAALALASINLVGSFVLTYAPLRHALPPMSLWVILIAGILLAPFNDNHVVVPVRAGEPDDGNGIDGLTAITQNLPPDRTIVFVASEGGGIRAAYWTAAVLDELDALAPDLKFRIRLLSGVSGGSLGVAAWLASHRHDFCPDSLGVPSRSVAIASADPPAPDARRDLAADFVSAAVAGLFYGDLVQRFLPIAIGPLDRSRGIEGAWQRAFSHLPGQPFENTLGALYRDCAQLPQLVLNATRVETGERVAQTLVPAQSGGRPVFINTFDGMQPGSALQRQSLAGLVHHSARFPVVSPAGTVEIDSPGPDDPASFRLVDGGYFDNSGVMSTLDVIGALQRKLGVDAFHPVLLLIRNSHEPLDYQAPHRAGASSLFPESGSIALALFNVRSSHAVTARGNARRLFGDDLIDIDVPGESAEAPLGWALSSAARASLDAGARSIAAGAVQQIRERIGAPVSKPAARDLR